MIQKSGEGLERTCSQDLFFWKTNHGIFTLNLKWLYKVEFPANFLLFKTTWRVDVCAMLLKGWPQWLQNYKISCAMHSTAKIDQLTRLEIWGDDGMTFFIPKMLQIQTTAHNDRKGDEMIFKRQIIIPWISKILWDDTSPKTSMSSKQGVISNFKGKILVVFLHHGSVEKDSSLQYEFPFIFIFHFHELWEKGVPGTLQETNISLRNRHVWVGGFLFPKVGYVTNPWVVAFQPAWTSSTRGSSHGCDST